MIKESNFNLTFYLRANFIKFFESNPEFIRFGYFIKKSHRIPIKMDSLWEFNPFLAKNLLENPVFCFQIFKEALNCVFCKNLAIGKIEKKIFVPDIIGPFGKKICPLNSLKARFLGELVYTEGIVQKVGEKRIKIDKLVHYTKSSGKFFVNDFKKEEENIIFQVNKENEFSSSEIEYGLSNFMDWQSIILEDIPNNQANFIFSKNLIAILENDLVDFCRKKEEIEICGILKPFYNSISPKSSSIFSPVLSVLSIKKKYKKNKIDPDQFDYFLMKNFSLLINNFEKLSSLILPKISGQKNIKKGILLFLASGNEHKKEDKPFISEKIHILLSAKQNFIKNEYFKFISHIFPSSIFLKHEIFEKKKLKPKNRTLEKKINEELVKNPLDFDGNILCIDQVEGLTQKEKYILKEILEQNSMTIIKNKSKISINSNCNVFATTGTFLKDSSYGMTSDRSFEISNSLINRFDLTLFIKDNFSLYEDKKMAKLLLETHRKVSSYSMKASYKNSNENIKKKTKKFYEEEKIEKKKITKERISLNFLKMYISFSKKNLKPIISGEATNILLAFYQKKFLLSKKQSLSNIRKLESVIKLTISFTKIQLRSVVLCKDVKKVIKYWKGTIIYEDNFLNSFQKKNLKNNNSRRNPENFKSVYKSINKKKTKKEKIKWEVNIKINNFWSFSVENIKNLSSDFIKIKKNLKSRKACSFFERLLFKWSARKICFIFNKNIVKI